MKYFLILMLFIVFGCRSAIKLIYGIKQPKYENQKSLDLYSGKLGIPNSNHCSLKPDNWINGIEKTNNEVFIFSKDGKYIPYKNHAKPDCSGPAELFLSYLDPAAEYTYSDEYTLNSFLNTLDCENIAPENEKKPDFYIFMTWAKFMGKLIYKQKTKVWIDSLQHNTAINYKLYMVNQDLQESWSKEEKEKIGLDSKH